MFNLDFIKVSLFRFVASALLALSIGSVMICESNVCAADRTFVKSHSPVSDNHLLALSADDKEDIDDDNSVALPASSGLASEIFSYSCVRESFGNTPTRREAIVPCQAYLRHRQLLI